jgi:hypothetical protein
MVLICLKVFKNTVTLGLGLGICVKVSVMMVNNLVEYISDLIGKQLLMEVEIWSLSS